MPSYLDTFVNPVTPKLPNPWADMFGDLTQRKPYIGDTFNQNVASDYQTGGRYSSGSTETTFIGGANGENIAKDYQAGGKFSTQGALTDSIDHAQIWQNAAANPVPKTDFSVTKAMEAPRGDNWRFTGVDRELSGMSKSYNNSGNPLGLNLPGQGEIAKHYRWDSGFE